MSEIQFHINPNIKGIEISPEVAAALGVKDGDSRFVTQSPFGVIITQHDVERAKTLELTKDFMARYSEALAELAK